ncbi:tRNA glutamyl-Q(34) synthetase GluQRS [Sphingomonas sp.]|uniref:tRNA glutamyl-Q(34) synthetase GluQRS n=1 Tax=Sphingomonas sp. TaxID=28214 RepID=UPI0035BBB50E
MTHDSGSTPSRLPVTTRFAPSPTGRLHLGHAYSALRAHDFARARGGRFLLRIEDIDRTRSRAEHAETIFADLQWLGLTWNGPVVFQSRRLGLYAAALDRFKALDLVYPCFCTRTEIAAASASAPHAPEPVYPGTCRGIDARGRMAAPHCWRIDMAAAAAAAGPLTWHDETAGEVACDALRQGDVVLARKDAATSYHLAATVDDAAQGVTDVVRGVDLFAATHVHRLLQALLGLPAPRYHHHPLLTDANGERLAKRHGSPALATMRKGGEDGRALADRLRTGIGIDAVTP